MLPLGAGLVFCEEMVAGWRQWEMVIVGLAGYLTPASLIPRVRTIFARGHMGNS